MNRSTVLLLAFALLSIPFSTACGRPLEFSSNRASDRVSSDPSQYQDEIEDLETRLDRAEARATTEGRKILQTGRSMIAQGQIIKGSCWDYINGVYTQAGFSSKNRSEPFKSKKSGPFADLSSIQPGDWLYYINHSYGDIEHSGIFVDWYDFENKEAVILSYPGENRKLPGRYKLYDLSSVYNVIRPKSQN